MKKEKNILEEALKYFGLGIDFTEDELTKVYKSKSNIIPIDFALKGIDHNVVDKNYIYYVVLYKCVKIRHIENILLKDVNLDNLTKESKPKILKLSKECADFYNKNFMYRSLVNTLLINIKTNCDLFCNIDIEKANTIEEVDSYYNNFILDTRKDFEEFASGIIAVTKREAIYNLNETIKLNFEKIDSIKQLLGEVYEAIRKLTEKKAMIKVFTNKVKEHFNIVVDDEDEEKIIKHEIQKNAMKYYAVMVKEKDYNKFLEVYKEAMTYIDSYIPEALDDQEEKKHRN